MIFINNVTISIILRLNDGDYSCDEWDLHKKILLCKNHEEKPNKVFNTADVGKDDVLLSKEPSKGSVIRRHAQ